MVAIKSIGKIVSGFIKTESTTLAQNDKAMFDFFKKMTSGYTKGHRKNDLPRICFEGSNYEELPSFVRSLADSLNLKRPNVIVRGRSLKQGQGTIGFKICDGDKVVGTTSYGLDLTRGEPIQQLRVSIGNGTERAISFNSMLDTNLTGKSALKCDTFVNRKLAKQMGLSDEILAEIPSASKVSANELNYQSQYLRELVANKGNMIHSIDECVDELAQIASKTGKVTEQSATEAIETVLSKMGYNPKNVKLNFAEKEFGNPGAFNQVKGELDFDLSQIGTHQDLADLIKHEFTHMEDYILFYKKVGTDKFKKLIGEDYNQTFYDNMSTYLSKNKNFAYDGNKTTNKTKKFGIKSMEQELKRDKRSCQNFDDSTYAKMKDLYEYINSDIEGHARFSENVFIHEIKSRGIYQKTSLSERYGRPPVNDPKAYSEQFEQIERALSKYGTKKGQKFNELYYQSLHTIDSELAGLYKQLEELPAEKAREVILKKANDLIKSRHRGLEYLDLKVMQEMQARLGLKPVPFEQENALQSISSEFAEIKDTIARNPNLHRDIQNIKNLQSKIAKSNLDAEEKLKLIDTYDKQIDYMETHGTIEGFELINNY